jgi:DNA-binding NtrC family response regulator
MPRILVVDDEENARIGLKKYLEGQKHQVVAAADGEEALIQLDSQRPDLVITDINMPQMNGLILLEKIMLSFPTIPVIMMTACGEIDTYLQSKNLGVFEYLIKPVRLAELKLLVDRITCERA